MKATLHPWHTWRTGAAALLTLLAQAATDGVAAPASTPEAAYQPLAFLVGHCWKGTFPDGQATDEHCFSWIYGGKFVRDEHVVHRGGGRPDDFGESIYLWDAASGELQYLYIESAGGFSRGTVTGTRDSLVFPAATFTDRGRTQTFRSRWQRTGDDAYEVVTEFRDSDRWAPGFSLQMRRVAREVQPAVTPR
jgi:hypothetical protein